MGSHNSTMHKEESAKRISVKKVECSFLFKCKSHETLRKCKKSEVLQKRNKLLLDKSKEKKIRNMPL